MRVTLLQTDIVWEDKQENLRLLRRKLKALRGVAEIVVLPETFSTGFSMDSRRLAEPVSGVTIATLRQWATEFQFAITGSYIACDEEVDANKNAVPIPDKSYYNRAFFLTPEGEEFKDQIRPILDQVYVYAEKIIGIESIETMLSELKGVYDVLENV